jgi:hypothetical protein
MDGSQCACPTSRGSAVCTLSTIHTKCKVEGCGAVAKLSNTTNMWQGPGPTLNS